MTRPLGLRIAIWPSCWKCAKGQLRRVDRDMREVRAAQTFDLRVEIREIAALQQRIVAEVDAGRNVLRHEGDLLGLGEEIVDQRSSTRRPTMRTGRISSGMILVGSSTSKSNLSANFWSNSCRPSSHSGKVAGLDRVPEVAAMEVRIGAVDLDRLVPRRPTAGQASASSEISQRSSCPPHRAGGTCERQSLP